MADDLGDEWWKESSDAKSSTSEGEDSDAAVPPPKKAVKRRADSESDDEPAETEDKPPSKKQKNEKKGKAKKKKKKRPSRRRITEEDEDKLHKPGSPADILLLMQAASSGDDSSSDDDDGDLPLNPETDFFPANKHLQPSKYLCQVLPGWQKMVKKSQLPPGSPLLLVLSSSAIRAVQLKRDLKEFLGSNCKTAKLFAKHMKLEEQKKALQKKVCHAGIGTPNRVQALLEAGSLKLNHLQCLVLDWNWRDVKLKRIVDIPDVKRDLTQLLEKFVTDFVKNSQCKIAIL